MNFISGATGFLGSHIARLLIERGEQVVAIKRKNSSFRFLGDIAERIIWKEGDINDLPSIESAMENCVTIYHCAAFISLQKKEAEKMYKINVEGTANMINVAQFRKVKKFIHISSVAALPAIESGLINEESIWYTKPYPSTYGLSKFLSEREVQRGMAEGLNCIIVNPSSILGHCNWNTGPGLFFTNMFQGLPFYTRGTGGFVDVKDLSAIILQLGQDPNINNDRFIVSAENLSYQELFEMIADTMKKKAPTIELNNTIGKAGILYDAITCMFNGNERIVTKESLQMANIKTNYDNSKVRNTLDFTFRPIKETIDETTRLFLKDKSINLNH